jgi:hypothetical protein
VQLLLNGLLEFFVKHYTVVVHYLQMGMKEYGCCPKFKRGDNSTGSVLQLCKVSQNSNEPFRRSCAYKVHDTPFVHYLQMCMKEYGCYPKFRRGDNSPYTFTKRGGGGMYLESETTTKLLIEFL